MFNDFMVTGAGEQQRYKPVFAPLRHNEVDAVFLTVANFIGVNFLTTGGSGMRVKRGFFKATFIKVNKIFCAVLRQKMAECSEILKSFGIRLFLIPGRFF